MDPAGRALIVIDVQQDFLPGGALAVPHGDEVLPVANRLLAHYPLAFATRDWHPPGHLSFAANHPRKRPGDLIELAGLPQVLWPVHCVQGTPGAELSPGLDRARIRQVIDKGTNPEIDSYSGFFDNGQRQQTELAEALRRHKVHSLVLLGLATDYCVQATALDAVKLGFETWLVVDGCRGVNLQPEDSTQALKKMAAAGVHLTTSAECLAGL